MPTYDYRCKVCRNTLEVVHRLSESHSKPCSSCGGEMGRVILKAPGTVVPPQHQAASDKMKYYGVKDIRTGEGITSNTDVRTPPGINVKSIKQ